MLEALGEHADPRARELVRAAEITARPATATWEGSKGRVHAHRVALGVDAAQLGEVGATPHLTDELVRAAAAAIAQLEPREATWTLSDLVLFWNGSARAIQAVYRDAPPPSGTLRDAVQAYLHARGETPAATHVAGITIEGDVHSPAVTVRGATRDHRAAIEVCLKALLRGSDAREVRITWH